MGLWGLLLTRTAYLQFLPNEKLNTLQTRQFQTVVTLPSRRGNIVDTNGKDLAMSSPAYSIYADPKIIEIRSSAPSSTLTSPRPPSYLKFLTR